MFWAKAQVKGVLSFLPCPEGMALPNGRVIILISPPFPPAAGRYGGGKERESIGFSLNFSDWLQKRTFVTSRKSVCETEFR